MTLMPLEESQKPLRCISVPRSPSCHYSSEHLLMEQWDVEGNQSVKIVSRCLTVSQGRTPNKCKCVALVTEGGARPQIGKSRIIDHINSPQ